MQKLLLSGSDVFYPSTTSTPRTPAGPGRPPSSKPSSPARPCRRPHPATPQVPRRGEVAPHLLRAGDETTVCDFTPQHRQPHPARNGPDGLVPGQQVLAIRPQKRGLRGLRRPGSVLERVEDASAAGRAAVPEWGSPAPGAQCDLENGEILLGVYHAVPGASRTAPRSSAAGSTAVSCGAVEHGSGQADGEHQTRAVRALAGPDAGAGSYPFRRRGTTTGATSRPRTMASVTANRVPGRMTTRRGARRLQHAAALGDAG